MNKYQDVEHYISFRIDNEFKHLSERLFQRLMNNQQEASNRGGLHSGLYVQSVLQTIRELTIESCKRVINEIVGFIRSTNREYKELEIQDYKHLICTKYFGFINDVYQNKYNELRNRFSFPDEIGETQRQFLLNEIKILVDAELDLIIFEGSLIEPSKAEKRARNANIISVLALIVAIAGLVISLVKKP